MRKIVVLLMYCLLGLFIVGCSPRVEHTLDILVPSGTPSIIIARLMHQEKEHNLTKHQIVQGSDPLIAAFTSNSHDIIYAPTNLGALMYHNNSNYILGAVVVWGNNFIVSKPNLNIHDITDLQGKKISVFGRNQTPDIVLKTVLSHYELLDLVEIEYSNDVTTITSMFLAGQVDVILSAEPSLSLIRKTTEVDVIDLQDEWMNISGSQGYPQVGIFINQDTYENKKLAIDNYLEQVKQEINDFLEDPVTFSEVAIVAHDSLALLGSDVIVGSIQSTLYQYKTALESLEQCQAYFNQILLLNPNLIGGSLPHVTFYKQE